MTNDARVEMVPVSAVVSNRYRRMATYVLSEEKLQALIQSYETSGFWDGSIQGRPSPEHEGKIEIAFGHHRVEAARRAKIPSIGITVADRSDADMLRMMADENRAEFKHDALVTIETIAAVVEAYDKGEIELDDVDKFNPAHAYRLPSGKRYALATVARFLGWVKPSNGQATNAAKQAFDAYCERAAIGDAINAIPSELRSGNAIDSVKNAVRIARVAGEEAGLKPAEIKEVERKAAKAAASELTDGSGRKASETIAGLTRDIVRTAASIKKKVRKKLSAPRVEIYIARLIRKCETVEPYGEILTECRRLIPFVDDIDMNQAQHLAKALETMVANSAKSVANVAVALRSGNNKRLRKLLEAVNE